MKWTEDVLKVLREVRGDLARAVQAGAETFAARSEPLVVLTGVHSSGKSALVKRLLADQSRPVPESLIVGGGPTSYEQSEYRLQGWTYLDTPGLESGRDHHDTSIPRFFDVLQVCLDGSLVGSTSELI